MKKLVFVLLLLFSATITQITVGKEASSLITPSISQWYTIVGYWEDDFIPNTIYRIRIDSQKKCYMDITEKSNPNKWEVMTELTEKNLNGFRVFFIKDTPEQYYILERNGNLSAFDNYGHISTYKKINP